MDQDIYHYATHGPHSQIIYGLVWVINAYINPIEGEITVKYHILYKHLEGLRGRKSGREVSLPKSLA